MQVNELLIEEEDYAGLRESITTFDNYDQIGLATRLERHELMEFRRIAAHIYKSNLRWRKAVALAKQDRLYKARALPYPTLAVHFVPAACLVAFGIASQPLKQAVLLRHAWEE